MALSQAGGTTFYDDAVSQTKQTVIAAPVLLFNIMAFNTGALSYLQFFDALEADVTVGSTAAKFTIPLPAVGGYDTTLNCPEGFRTGIVIANTATATGSGAPGAPALVKLTYVGG